MPIEGPRGSDARRPHSASRGERFVSRGRAGGSREGPRDSPMVTSAEPVLGRRGARDSRRIIPIPRDAMDAEASASIGRLEISDKRSVTLAATRVGCTKSVLEALETFYRCALPHSYPDRISQ